MTFRPAVALIILALAVPACSPLRKILIRNESAADVFLVERGGRPDRIAAGETSGPKGFAYVATDPDWHVVRLRQGGCVHTYPLPDLAQLPPLESRTPMLVIDPALTVHLFDRTADGSRGVEIVAGGFPMRATTDCSPRAAGPA